MIVQFLISENNDFNERTRVLSYERLNAYFDTIPSPSFIGDNSIHRCKQGPVFTHTHILTRMNFGTALANKNTTRLDQLTGVTLYTATLPVTIATISCRSTC